MATITTIADGKQVTTVDSTGKFVSQARVSFADTNVVSTDVVQLLKVGKGWLVNKAYVNVVTAEGATATCTIGDAGDPNGLIASVDLNATGLTGTLEATDAYGVGNLYAAADTIDLDPAHDLDACVIDIIIEGIIVEGVKNA